MLSTLVLACLALGAQCSVLVPTYVLPPSSFIRDQRSLPATRTLARLAGGHLKLHTLNSTKDSGKGSDHYKNTFAYVDKDKGYDEKFAGVVVKTEGQNVGWNQGQWDDGMLMSSAGNGKDKKQKQEEEKDEDKKTLADQVAEGKYGLIQKEIFVKMPSRPGVVSYATNPETKNKDNEGTLGGLRNEEIWLAEDHLLVLRGGSLPEHGPKPGTEGQEWPAIDDYKAPARQVKIPHNPEVPPPFPVRLSDGGPLVFLTPNGSVPAPILSPLSAGAGNAAFPPETLPYPPAFPPSAAGPDQGDFTPGRAPFPIAPFPFLPRNGSEPPFPFPNPLIDGSIPGLPPGAAFLPPPPPRGNLSDLYDEDDPSIYYPPPYSFSYSTDNTSKVPAGPLVPGIVLPPPPDFFAPLDPPTTTKPTAHAYPPTSGAPPTVVLRPRPPQRPSPVYLPTGKPGTVISDSPDNSIDITSTPPTRAITFAPRPIHKKPTKVVIIPKPSPPRKIYTTSTTVATKPASTTKPLEKKRPSVTILQKPIKTTLKPVPGSLYEISDKNNYFEGNSVSPSPQPFLVYGPPEKARLQQYPENTYVTSTPVPLKAYFNNHNYDNVLQLQFARQNSPNTRIRPEFYSPKQNGKSVASFYFYEEPIAKPAATTPAPQPYYDDRNYYQTIKESGQVGQEEYYYGGDQGGFVPTSNLDFRPIPSREPSPFFFVPQRQGSRTLTQEYFSINQNTKTQNNYVQPQQVQQPLQQSIRPNSFFDEIANIQQTIDYYTTLRPNVNLYQNNGFREVRQKAKPAPRPVYQFNYQNNNPQSEQNTFRAPKMDPEPFRPMVSYSKPYKIKNQYSTTPQPNINVVIENQISTTEISQPSKYYTTAKPEDYDYEDAAQKLNVERATIKPPVVTQAQIVKPQRVRNHGPTTKSPVNHAYYTKQEENLFDDITKNYFTIFGQKIENGNKDNQGIAVTTPIRPIEVSTIKTPINNNINIRYAHDDESNSYRPTQKPISLASDTDINYRQPRPLINPESEFIPIVNPEIQAKYEAEQLKQIREQLYHKQRAHNVEIIKSEPIQEGHQFARDQLDYYRRPVQNHQIQAPQRGVSGVYSQRGQVAEGRPGSLIAYRLPGEGAHVYFLTPQPARPENFKYRTAEELADLS